MEFKTKTLAELQPTMDAVFHYMFTFGPNVFDLREIPININNVEHVAVLLRGLASCKSQINGYNSCLNRCIDVCYENRVDPRKMLFGMMPDDAIDLSSNEGSKLFVSATEKFFGEKITHHILLDIEITCNNLLLKYPRMTYNGVRIARFKALIDLINPSKIHVIPVGLDGNHIHPSLQLG